MLLDKILAVLALRPQGFILLKFIKQNVKHLR